VFHFTFLLYFQPVSIVFQADISLVDVQEDWRDRI